MIMMASVFEQSYKENNHIIGAERSPGIQRQTLSYVISNVIHVDRNVTYQPIRIHVIYCMYFELSVEDRERIIGIVIKAVGKISQLLSDCREISITKVLFCYTEHCSIRLVCSMEHPTGYP